MQIYKYITKAQRKQTIFQTFVCFVMDSKKNLLQKKAWKK